MSCPPNKKLRTPSGVSDINKQNTGWRARMVWIRSIPQEVTDGRTETQHRSRGALT
jgi:hypothetical protein